MLVVCCGGLECVLCATCARWAWRRCSHAGAHDSASLPSATAPDFTPIPRACRAILAAYEDDLSQPKWSPSGYGIHPASVIRRASNAHTAHRCPPYLIYLDRHNSELVLAVRGLNLGRRTDYRLLLDNRPESQLFHGGYVHRGLLKAAVWILNREAETLRRALKEAVYVRDTFIPEEKLLRDPRRLYAPGRMFHIVERQPCSCGRMPPEVRTAIPVEGRFEHIVLSCNAVYDHSLVWIEREAQKALDRMEGGYEAMIPPTQPIIATRDGEHKDAVEKAAQLTKDNDDLDGGMYKVSYIPLDDDGNEMNSESVTNTDWEDVAEMLLSDEEGEGPGR